MAITISGENNNDKILASDGVIDQISGINIVGLITASHINVGSNIQLGNAGIITATTFVGNVTGNVNSTSPLLLQTGGSERFRITGNNELGIAGANYGTSGQVLTSGGSGSAVSWTTPAVTGFTNGSNNRVVTATSGSGLNAESNLTYDGNTLFASGNITAASDGNRLTQGGVALTVRHLTNSAMRANHFIHDDFPTGSATYFIQATESGVTNDRNLCLQGYGGKVKIGSSSEPVETLDVTGNVKATSINLANSIFHTGDTDTLMSFSTDTIKFETAGSERLRITSDGKFSLGNINATPNAAVHIDYDTNNMFMLDNSTAQTQKMFFAQNGGVHAQIYATSAQGSLVFDSDPSGNHNYSTIDLNIDGGTKLQLNSSGNFTFYNSSAAWNTIQRATATHFIGLRLQDADATQRMQFGVAGTAGHIITSSAQHDVCLKAYDANLIFATDATERLRITSSGNITTSSTVGHVLLGTDTARTINSHNGRLQVTGTSYSHSTMSIINNEANGNGAYIFLGKQRSGAVGGNTAVQANDIIGELRFPAGDGTDMENYAARIQVKADQNASSNNTSGYIDFYTTRQNGSSEHKMRMTQNSNHSHLFSMGTGTSHLNNCSTPDRTSVKIGGLLHLEGPTGHNATPGMYYNCYSGGNDLFYRGTGAPSGGDRRPAAYGQKFGGHYFYGDNSSTAWNAQQQITSMATNMQITSQGYVLKSNTPGFFQRNMNGAEYNNGQLKGGSNNYNTGNHYNTTSGIFTAPIAGRYAVGCGILVNAGSGRLEGNISLNNSTRLVTFNGTGSTYDGPNAHTIVNLAANDTLRVLRQSGTAYPYNHDNHYFYAYLVG